MRTGEQFKELKMKELFDCGGGYGAITGPYVLPQMIATWMVSLFVK